MTRLGVILFAALAILVLPGASASAQYPPPTDNVVVSVSNPRPPINSTVTISWSSQEPGSCVARIVSQPGSDAALLSVNAPPGSAVLFTGSTEGTVFVEITCPPNLQAGIAVQVGLSPAISISLLTESTASAPESVSASSGRSTTTVTFALGAGVAAVATAGSVLVWRRGRERRHG